LESPLFIYPKVLHPREKESMVLSNHTKKRASSSAKKDLTFLAPEDQGLTRKEASDFSGNEKREGGKEFSTPTTEGLRMSHWEGKKKANKKKLLRETVGKGGGKGDAPPVLPVRGFTIQGEGKRGETGVEGKDEIGSELRTKKKKGIPDSLPYQRSGNNSPMSQKKRNPLPAGKGEGKEGRMSDYDRSIASAKGGGNGGRKERPYAGMGEIFLSRPKRSGWGGALSKGKRRRGTRYISFFARGEAFF